MFKNGRTAILLVKSEKRPKTEGKSTENGSKNVQIREIKSSRAPEPKTWNRNQLKNRTELKPTQQNEKYFLLSRYGSFQKWKEWAADG